MNFIPEKLVESILILMVFYLVYLIFFIRQASFRINRFLLLAGIISGLVFPFIHFPIPNIQQLGFLIQLKEVEVFGNSSKVDVSRSVLSISQTIGFMYFIGVTILGIRFLYHLFLMSRLYANSRIVKRTDENIVFTNKEHSVFSFLSNVFIGSNSEHCKDLKIILDHERVHVVQKHTIDLLLLELLAIVQWFNPIVWHYKKLVRQNHEYLADRGTLMTGVSDEIYQELLLGNYRSLKLGFTNSFNHSLTFKRLVMMKKINSNKKSAIKLLFIAPIILISVYFISCSSKQDMKNDLKDADKQSNLSVPPPPPPPVTSDKSKVEDIVDPSFIQVKPEFPGGDQALIKFVAENTKYPEQAKEKGIQGTVYVRFVVTKTGEIGQTTIMRSVDPYLEAEALRVIKSLPKWTPGIKDGKPVDVWFIIPVKFKLQ